MQSLLEINDLVNTEIFGSVDRTFEFLYVHFIQKSNITVNKKPNA